MAQNIIFRVVADTQPAVDGMNKLGNATDKTKKDVSQLDQALGKIGTMVAGAFAIDKIVEFGKAVYKVSNEVNSLESRMQQLQGSTDLADRAFGNLMTLSNKLGLNFIDLTQNYTQFMSAAKANGVEMSKAEKIFTNMSIAIKGAGINTEGANRAMIAITQMMAKGKISAEELNGQLAESGLSGSIGYMAKSLGVGTKELLKMMEQGKLTSDALLGFSQVARDELGGGVEKMSQGIEANVQRLSNSWDAYMANLGQRFYGQGGGAEVLADLLDWFTRINQSSEQYLQSERRRLLSDVNSQERVEKELKNLKEQKATQEEILKFLKFERDANLELAKTGKNRHGIQQNLSTGMKIELLKLSQAYSSQIKAIEDESKAKENSTKLTDKQIKAIERERLARIELKREMEKTLKDIFTVDFEKPVEDPNFVGAPTMGGETYFQRKARQRQQEEKDKQKDLEQMRKWQGIFETEQGKAFADELKELDLKHRLGIVKEEAYLQDLLALRKKYGMDVSEVEGQITISDVDKKKIQKAQITKLAGETAEGVTNTILAYKQKEIDGERDMVENQRQQGLISEEQYDQQMRAIKRKQAIADRIAAIAQIAINTAIALTNPTNIASFGAISPFIIASGAIQTGIVLAQPLPYNKGTKRVPMMRGAVRGRDSVHAILTPDERVVPADINMQPGYSALLDLAQDKKISDKEAGFLAELATSGMRRTGTQQSIDPDIIGKAIAKHIPHTNVAINDRGIAVITERSQTEIRRLRRRIG